MQAATKEFLLDFEALCEKRKQAIRNTKDISPIEICGDTYFVSGNGNDDNDGRTPETPWKTREKVSAAELLPGDCVRFRRGDIFRGALYCQTGVTYTGYGEGEKPRFYGWTKSMADPELWICIDEEHCIWKFMDPISDCGTLVFNDGEYHSRKLIPSYIRGRFMCREDETKPFVIAQEMTKDLDIFCYYVGNQEVSITKGACFPVPNMYGDCRGDLYLRCDKGNPGKVFDKIEAVCWNVCFNVCAKPHVHIDNICIKYARFGIDGGRPHVIGLHVTNCEIGWIGGNVQNYTGIDPNYPEGKRGSVTRFGNGIEIYGGSEDFLVSNCYVYQVYDAGMTHQVSTNGHRYVMRNIRYKDNLIEKCVYGIEYFLDKNIGGEGSYMDNIEMSGNIILDSGFGWGQQRHNKHTPAHIKGWSYENTATNYTIHDNVFGRAAYKMVHLVAKEKESCPKMYRNTYIQTLGGKLGRYGYNQISEPECLTFDENAEQTIISILGDKNAKVYYIED